MNTTLSLPSRAALSVAALALTASLCSAQITDWYLVQSQVGDYNWNSVNSSAAYKNWADGGDVYNYDEPSRYATAMDAGATYHVLGTWSGQPKLLRTRGINTGVDTFAGSKLVMTNTSLLVRATVNGVSSVDHLVATGLLVRPGFGNNLAHNLSVGLFEAQAGASSLFTVGDGAVNRTTNASFTTLTGAGDITFSEGGGGASGSAFNVSIADATGYTGGLVLTSGSLSLLTDFASGGALSLNGGSVTLGGDVTVASLSVVGTDFAVGTYDAAALSGHGVNVAGAGTITVASIPEPAHAVLGLGLVAGVLGALRRRRRG